MAGSVAYTVMASLRPEASTRPFGTVIATPLDALLVPVVGTISRFADLSLVPVVGAITRFVDASPSSVGLETLLGVGWVMLTLAVAAVLMPAHLRLRADRSTWTASELDGRDVLVSEDLGPGVVGWIRSVIVMPRWAFAMAPQERELMLQHEGEHCNAGDTRLTGLSLLLLTLFPWNIPLWWQIHRLRLAIEIDCDHRVLHRTTDVKRYAMLLVEIGARGSASRLSALAFARPIPSIERRILAMTDPRDDPRYIRMIGLTLLAALLVVASCQVE
jgi:beta-lactamase regulating signal transducer with metallopeptidase domain